MNKPALIDFLQQGFEEVASLANGTPKASFYCKPADNVWSAAENVQHLTQSVQPLNRLFGRPKSYMEEKWGTSRRSSRSYEGLIETYHKALGNGATAVTAPGAFVPLTVPAETADLLHDFRLTNDALIVCLSDWSEDELDKYLIPHPLMGPLTVREMLLFTAYHTRHHLEIMEKRAGLKAGKEMSK
ncbi:MAG: DinB family protein [Spirosomataceae bacterium]